MSSDRFGRAVVDNSDGTYSVPGITIEADSLDAAIVTFDAMQPDGWTEPVTPEPLDAVGALATLLVVVGALNVVDAANAVQRSPEDLVAEAQAWAIAGQP